MDIHAISRRRFLRATGLFCSGIVLGACSKQTEQTKSETVAAAQHDKFPTATPVVETGVTNAYGRELLSDAAAPEEQLLIEPEEEPKHLDFSRDRYAARAALNWGSESLLQLDDHWVPVPSLAESFTEGQNAEYFDFTIREGAKWSDGTPITAADMVYTLQHLSDPALGNPWVSFYFDIKGIKARWLGESGPEEIGAEAVDDRTVRIHGEGPIPHLPQMLAVQGTGPVPKHVVEKDPEHWADSVEGYVTSGPFMAVAWEKGISLEWGVNPNYNGPIKPALQRVLQRFDEPENGWFWAWKERQVDLLYDLGFANIRAAQTTAVIVQQLHYLLNARAVYCALNTLAPPLDNLKLRQALSHALDRETWAGRPTGYSRIGGYTMLPPEIPGYNEALLDVQAFDAEKAKALLAEAGYPDGKDSGGKQLELTLAGNMDDQYASFRSGDLAYHVRAQEIIDFVKSEWEANLGIAVTVKELAQDAWNAGRAERELEVYIGRYEYDYRDAANLLGSLWRSIDDKGSMYHAWKSDSFDELVTKAGQTTDEAQRLASYQEAERILVEDVGAVFLSHNNVYTMWWPHLTGIHYTQDGLQLYRPDLTRFELYVRDDFAKWRDQSGTTATGERHTPATPVVK